MMLAPKCCGHSHLNAPTLSVVIYTLPVLCVQPVQLVVSEVPVLPVMGVALGGLALQPLEEGMAHY